MRITRFLSGISLNFTLLKQFLTLTSAAFLVTACGGGGSDNKTQSSSSNFSFSYSSASISSNGTGVWPSVKVNATQAKTLTFSWSAVDGASYYKLMKNESGNSGYVQVGDNVTGTTATDEIGVHLHDWINTKYLVQWCNSANVCQDSDNTYTVTEMLKSIGKMRASNAEANDLFGWSVALSGDGQTLAVGAPAEDSNATGVNGDETSNTSKDSGAVYVFVKRNGLWEKQAYLKASNTEQPSLHTSRFLDNDRFGYRVAISDDGNTIAVSAINEDSPSWGVNCNENNVETTEIRRTSSSSSSSTSRSSTSSSKSSSIGTNDIFIYAESYNVGAVYVFKRADETWSQTAYIKPEYSVSHLGTSSRDLLFGQVLSMSGDGKTIAVGSPVDVFSFVAPNNIKYFNRSSERACLNYADLNLSSRSSTSNSNSSSSTSSSKASSTSNSTSSSALIWGGDQSGAVYTFVETETGWKPEAWLKPTVNQSGDNFGISVALSKDGNNLAVGAIGEDSKATGVNGNARDNSCFYADNGEFKVDTGCTLLGKVVGVEQLNNGAAYIFVRDNDTWTQKAYLKPATTYWNAQFGSAVDISDDGLTLAVGALGDANQTNTVINGATVEDKNVVTHLNSGAAYIFKYNGSTWAQEAYVKPEVSLPAYQFGNTVKLSANGDLLAVGSYREASESKGINGNPGDTSADSAGAMFIFKRENDQWSRDAYVKASDTKEQDRFGIEAGLSDDGKTMAVGAYRKSGAATSSQSTEATGAVYIY